MMLRTDQREDTTAVGLIGSGIRRDLSFGVRVTEAKLKLGGLLRREEVGGRTLLSADIEAKLNGAH